MIPNKKVVRGIAQDYAPIDMPQGAMRTARNVYLNDTLNAVSNEKGFEELVGFTNNLIGSISIEEDNIVLFSIDSQELSEIGIYYNKSNTYIPILRSDLLDFQKSEDLKGVFVRNYKKELIISFVDNYNKPRLINLDNLPVAVDSLANMINSSEIDLLNLFPEFKHPIIKLNQVKETGSVNTGTVQLCAAYVLSDNTYTNFSYIGNPIVITEGSSEEDIYSLQGSVGGIKSGKSVVWDISNLDTRYEKIVFAVIEKNEGVVTAKILGEKPTDVNSFTYLGSEFFESVDIAQIIVNKASYTKAKTICELDNRLFLGNVETTESIDYQEYANNINLKWTVENVDLIVSRNSHKDPKKLESSRGFMWDEVYAFYICFLMKDGTLSKHYHIPGRESLDGETDTMLSLVEDNTHLRNDLSIDGDLKFFHTRETASKDLDSSDRGGMGYWENSNEEYPDTEEWGALAGQNVRHHKFPSFSFYKGANSFYEEPNYYSFKIEDLEDSIKVDDGFGINFISCAYAFADNNYGEDFSNCSVDSQMKSLSVTASLSDDVIYNKQKAEITALTDCDFNLDIDISLLAESYSKQNGSNCDNPYDFGENYVFAKIQIIKIDTSGNESILHEEINDELDQNNNEWETITAETNYSNLLNISMNEGDRIRIVAYAIATAADTGAQFSGIDFNRNTWTKVTHSIQVKGYTTEQFSGSEISGIRTMPILGVNAENIEIPVEIADQVDGYFISYAKRTVDNMRVIGWSGCFHDQSHHPVYDNYIGAGAGTNYLSSDTAEHIHWKDDTLRFHAFDMMFDQYNVKPNFLKVNACLNVVSEDVKQIDLSSFTDPDTDYGTDNEQRATLSSKIQTSFRADYISGTVTDHNFITQDTELRKVSQGEYITADNFISSLKSGTPLANMMSESCYHATIHHTNSPSISTSKRNYYDWTPYNNGFTSNKLHMDDTNMQSRLMLISLYAHKEDMYVNFYNQEIVSTNKVTNISGEGTYSSTKIFGGDISVSGYGVRLTAGVRMEQTDKYITTPDATNKFEATKCIYYFPTYSINNVGLRNKGLSEVENFYPSVGKEYSNYTSWVRRMVDEANDNIFLYNSDYTSVNDSNNSYGAYNPYTKEVNNLPYRVVRSKSYQPEDEEFSLRIFTEADYYEMPKTKGDIQNIENLSSSLIIQTQYSLFKTSSKESLETNSIELTLGSGDIFRNPPQELIPTDSGYAGCQNASSTILFKAGYFFVDKDQGKVFLLDNAINEISNQGMRNFFMDHLSFKHIEEMALIDYIPSDQNPADKIGYTVAFDEENNRLLFTKKDYIVKDRSWLTGRFSSLQYNNGVLSWNDNVNQESIPIDDSNFLDYFIEDSFTISYDLDSKMWISFHDYYPNHATNSRNNVYSFNKSYDYLYGHNAEDIYGIYYNQDTSYRSYVDLVHNENQPYTKVFSSLQWMTESLDSYGNFNYKDTFTQAMLYNSHQCSGEISLEHLSNMRYVEGSWSFNAFRDLVSDKDFPFLDDKFNLIDENIDSNKLWTDQKRFVDKYLISRLIYDNSAQNSLYLYYYGSRNRLSAR